MDANHGILSPGKSSPLGRPRQKLRRHPGSASQPWARPTHDMNVQVVHFLPSFGAGVADHPESTSRIRVASLFCGQPRGQQHHAAHEALMLRRKLGQRRNMLLRHHQEVHRGPRLDIVEDKQFFVLIDLPGWNLTCNDFAENAVGIVFKHGCFEWGPVRLSSRQAQAARRGGIGCPQSGMGRLAFMRTIPLTMR